MFLQTELLFVRIYRPKFNCCTGRYGGHGGGTFCTVDSMFEKQGEHDLAETETLDKYLLCALYVNTKWDTAVRIFITVMFSSLFHFDKGQCWGSGMIYPGSGSTTLP